MRLFRLRASKRSSSSVQETTERNTPALIGYARTAPGETSLAAQREMLLAAGCGAVFTDAETTGSPPSGPGLHEALERLDTGSILVVTRLDRLGHALPQLLKLLAKLADEEVTVRALEQDVDTGAATAEAQRALIMALSECERAKASEHTRVGLSNARRNGVRVGRRPALSQAQVEIARELVASGRLRKDVARSLGVSLPTLRRSLRAGDER